MNPGQAGRRFGTLDAQWREEPDSKSLGETRIEADAECPSPEIRELLEQVSEVADLEVDEDDEMDEHGEGLAEEESTGSAYATSTYPRLHLAYDHEYHNENAQDSATIDSSRSLYAEDIDFVVEHGRQYCGDYFMPVDQTEQTRQYVIHQVYLKLFDLELTTVPLEDPRYILDIGTGIGEWAIGMAEKYPRCEVFGTDIAPIQPTHQVPFNIEFHIENAEEEWIRPANTVDLVHIRNLEGAFSDWRFIYNQAFACIRPGGWIEVVDWEDWLADKNFLSLYPEGSAMGFLVKAVLEAAEIAGKPRGSHHLDRNLLIEAGFVDIKETVYDLGIGTRENSSYGRFWLFSCVTGIEPSCMRLLTRHLGWDEEVVRDLCDQAARETKMMAEDPNRVEAFVVKLRVVVGRKPLMAGQWTAKTLNEDGEIKEYSGDESTIGDRTILSDEAK